MKFLNHLKNVVKEDLDMKNCIDECLQEYENKSSRELKVVTVCADEDVNKIIDVSKNEYYKLVKITAYKSRCLIIAIFEKQTLFEALMDGKINFNDYFDIVEKEEIKWLI